MLALVGCQTTGSHYGEGAIRLSGEVYRGFQTYLEGEPLTFAITEDGQNYFYYYCSESGCDPIRTNPQALYRCEQRHGRPCKIFAIRDQVVWKNPGDWQPASLTRTARDKEVEARSTDPVERIRNELAGNESFQRYRHSPGHKALVAMVNETNGDVLFWGYSFGQTTATRAIEIAFDFCTGGHQSYRQVDCRVVEVNDEALWPAHKDELTPDQIHRVTAAGVQLPLLRGNRPISVVWSGGEDFSGDVDYAFGLGRITFEFDHGLEAQSCDGHANLGETLGKLDFELTCGDGGHVQGTGTYELSGRTVTLNGDDEAGNRVKIDVGPDPAHYPE